jgi:hypothetical protein
LKENEEMKELSTPEAGYPEAIPLSSLRAPITQDLLVRCQVKNFLQERKQQR